MVSAWASQNKLVLGQRKVDSKSNEITAIPKLLDVLDLQGCVITIDAIGCQKTIAAKIAHKQADYIPGVKENQGGLLENVRDSQHWHIENKLPWVLDVAFHEDQSRK
jgi:predicted transposase YbfD/YdcC